MLDKTRLDYTARTNPVKVVRAVAAMVRTIWIWIEWIQVQISHVFNVIKHSLETTCSEQVLRNGRETKLLVNAFFFHHSIVYIRHHSNLPFIHPYIYLSIHSLILTGIVNIHQQTISALSALPFLLMGTLSHSTYYYRLLLLFCYYTFTFSLNPGHNRREVWRE